LLVFLAEALAFLAVLTFFAPGIGLPAFLASLIFAYSASVIPNGRVYLHFGYAVQPMNFCPLWFHLTAKGAPHSEHFSSIISCSW
jgi:hypothetical protein